MTRLGFTGTRDGMTERQRAMVRALMRFGSFNRLVHGMCVGADVEAHEIAKNIGMETEGYPCDLIRLRADCDVDILHEPMAPLVRNTVIVDVTKALLAVPSGPEELRSGTWFTIRYARRVGKPLLIVWPNGGASNA